MKNLFDSILILSWAIVFLTIATGFAAFQYSLDTVDHNKEVEVISKEIAPQISGERKVVVQLGKQLFKSNCASCHAKNMKSQLTGPALGGVEARWNDYPKEDLYNWIKNSAKLIQEGHPKALEVWKEWDKKPMNSFPNLKDDEIAALLDYIDFVGE